MKYCEHCGKDLISGLHTIYNEDVCEDCWDDYICTDMGKIEYLIGICRGDLSLHEFDADFLGEVMVSWKLNKNLTNLSEAEKVKIEETAEELGLI